MRFHTILAATVVAFLSGLAGTVHAATIQVDFTGTFDTSVVVYGGANPAAYPYPGLLGGTVVGSFSYDAAATPISLSPSLAEFPYLASQVELYDTGNNLVYTLSPGPNDRLRVLNFGLLQMNFGISGGGPPNTAGDFRLNWASPIQPSATPPSANDLNTLLTFSTGFSETDAFSSGQGWDLMLTSIDMQATTLPLPEPAAGGLAAVGALALLVWRRRASQPAG